MFCTIHKHLMVSSCQRFQRDFSKTFNMRVELVGMDGSKWMFNSECTFGEMHGSQGCGALAHPHVD
jgi:hypothetical protein